MEKVVYITYEEAQRLKPFFRYSMVHGPYKEARESSSRILQELGNVRRIDYSPFGGYQMFLKGGDYEFYIDALTAMEDR